MGKYGWTFWIKQFIDQVIIEADQPLNAYQIIDLIKNTPRGGRHGVNRTVIPSTQEVTKYLGNQQDIIVTKRRGCVCHPAQNRIDCVFRRKLSHYQLKGTA